MSLSPCVCPICRLKFVSAAGLGSHLDDEHEHSRPPKITSLQWAFNVKRGYPAGKQFGVSIMTKKPTPWNEKACRYEKLANGEKEAFRQMFRARMMKSYGKDTLLDDPEHQKKMLAGRGISGVYVYSDGRKFGYTGSYEKDFIEHLDVFLGWPGSDVLMPAPGSIPYTNPEDKKQHIYIPDAFIPTLGMYVEIKASDNNHYRARDIVMERAKDRAAKALNMRYVKIFDKDYSDFDAALQQARNDAVAGK